MIFPTVSGTALDGRALTVPAGLEGEYNLLVVAFQQRQRLQVDMWMWNLRPLSQAYPSLRLYELPTIQNLQTVQNDYADAWSRRGENDPVARRFTIPIYVDINDFNRSLDIATVTTTYCMLIDREGEVLWRMQGGYDPLKLRSLKKSLEHVIRARRPAYAWR